MKRLKIFYYRYIALRFFSRVIYTSKVLKAPNYSIGEHTYGWPLIYFANSGKKLVIGNYCSIAEGVKIFLGGNHRTDWISTYPFNELHKIFSNGANVKGHPASKGDVVIGNDVWIGNGVTIMSGVTIGDGAVIAANTTVVKNIEPYSIVAGNPMIVLKKRFDDKTIEDLLKIKWWDWPAEKVNENLHLICSTGIKSFIEANL